MPAAITAEQQAMIGPFLEALGVPKAIQPAVWQAVDAAGLTAVSKSAGTPVQVIESVPVERMKLDGHPGVYLVGVRVGERGWVGWVEFFDGAGNVQRFAPFFSTGGAAFVAKTQTSGKWTVGKSKVGGPDKIK